MEDGIIAGGRIPNGTGNVNDNHIIINGSVTGAGCIYGGYAALGTGTAKNNTITLNQGGSIDVDSIYGGFSGEGEVSGNVFNLNGGYAVANDVGGFQTYNFELEQYAINNATAIIENTYEVELSADSLDIDIGGSGDAGSAGDGTYKLFTLAKAADSTAKSGITNHITALSGALTKYATDIDTTAGELKIYRTTDKQGFVNTVTSGENGSSSNAGIADALANLSNEGGSNLVLALEYFQTVSPAALNRLVSEINPTNATSSTSQIGKQSVQQFNAAFGQVFGDNFAQQIAANSAYSTGTYSASAGGVPTELSSSYVTGFAKVYGGFGAQGSSAKAVGYDFGGVGFLTGLGYRFANELELGALFGYSYNNADLYQHFGTSTDNILRLGLYGNYHWNNFYYNTAPTFGIHLMNTERYIDTLSTKTSNDRTGFDFSWFNRAGYTFELPHEFFLTPSYALGMTYFHDPAHHEYGPGTETLGINYHAYDHWSLLQTLDLRVGKLIRVNSSLAILPEVWGGWEHDYITPNNATTNLTVAPDTAFVTPVQAQAQDRALLGVGITTLVGQKYEVYGRYDARLWDRGNSHQFTVGLSVKF
jgi:uncharacterized protein with beta-barrel porin domain